MFWAVWYESEIQSPGARLFTALLFGAGFVAAVVVLAQNTLFVLEALS